MGDWRLCLLSPWGGRVHAPWTIALAAWLRERGELELESVWSDDGIVLRMPARERPPEAAELLPDPEALRDLVVRELPGTSLYAGRFREAAARALLLPRRRPGQRSPLWVQRKRAHELLQVAARYPAFPIVLEAARECLNDVFDLEALVDLARRVQAREIRLVTVDTQTPSPFAASLLFGYVANYLYDGDAPLAERRAQLLSVDTAELRELVGGAELRGLLDRQALEALELKLQGLGVRAGPRRVEPRPPPRPAACGSASSRRTRWRRVSPRRMPRPLRPPRARGSRSSSATRARCSSRSPAKSATRRSRTPAV